MQSAHPACDNEGCVIKELSTSGGSHYTSTAVPFDEAK